ncbi:hypothetical protein GOBAR_DD32960 [Gossypium barbadense]|nr:hypothetical protein GOBAR_DD32960 [Gossypium barbadense]
MILIGHLKEPANFFYYYCGMTLHPFALPEFEEEERARGGTDLLIASTDPRVVDGEKGYWGYEDNFSESDSILYKLNKVMDFDTLIGSGRKKRKTSAGAVRTNHFNEEEKSGAPLEHRQKRKFDRGYPLPPTPGNSSIASAVERMPVKAGEDLSSSLHRLLYEGSTTMHMAHSIVGDALNLVPPSMAKGVTNVSSTGEGLASVNADQGVGGLMM